MRPAIVFAPPRPIPVSIAISFAPINRGIRSRLRRIRWNTGLLSENNGSRSSALLLLRLRRLLRNRFAKYHRRLLRHRGSAQ